MGRLIDANLLIERIYEYQSKVIETEDVVHSIKTLPTAYDTEKVVAELEEYKYSHLVEHDSERYEHCKEEEINCDGRDCFLCVWDKAISIVRNGGV